VLNVVAVAPDTRDEAIARITRVEASIAATEAVSVEGTASAVSSIAVAIGTAIANSVATTVEIGGAAARAVHLESCATLA
jgi:hypothetical protein